MKCDELKAETIVPQGCTITLQMYPKAEVDAAIAELNAKLAEKDEDIAYWRKEYDEETKLTDALKAEIESLKASHYAEMVDAGMRERRLRRALWLARAQMANEHYHRYHGKFMCPLEDIPEYVKWKQVERKCLAKAEEYK